MTVAALVISILALCVAVTSATFTGLSYRLNRRADARKAPAVRTTLGTYLHGGSKAFTVLDPSDALLFARQADEQFCIGVRAHNAGERPVDVVNVFIRMRPAFSVGGWRLAPLAGHFGHETPLRLEANAGLWWFPLSRVRSRGQMTELTFELHLADGTVVKQGPHIVGFEA